MAASDALTGSASKAFTGLPMCLWYCTRYEAARDLPMPPLPCSTRWTRRRPSLRLGLAGELLVILVRRGGVPAVETAISASFIGGAFSRGLDVPAPRPAGWGGRAAAVGGDTAVALANVPDQPAPTSSGHSHASAVNHPCWSGRARRNPSGGADPVRPGRLTMLRSARHS